jgi:hypothetical protein
MARTATAARAAMVAVWLWSQVETDAEKRTSAVLLEGPPLVAAGSQYQIR